MAQTKSQIQGLLADAETEPRHRFGQNFMIDQNLVRIVAAEGKISSGDVVIEVGPGTGTLTEELIASPAEKVVAVEIDRDLAGVLRDKFANVSKFSLIEGDALAGKHELNAELMSAIKAANGMPVKLIANLPYNIASPLVIELLLAGVNTLVFTVQKEVADRLKSAHASDDYGPLTVMAQSLAKVEVLRTLPAQAFWPAPKIESSLVRMTLANVLGESANVFGRFVQQIFSTRRKTLRKSLSMSGYEAEKVLVDLGFDGMKRPEEFSPAELRALFQATRA